MSQSLLQGWGFKGYLEASRVPWLLMMNLVAVHTKGEGDIYNTLLFYNLPERNDGDAQAACPIQKVFVCFTC